MRLDKKNSNWKNGQTIVILLLVSLMLVFMVTTTVAVVFSLLKDTTVQAQGEQAMAIAQSAAQNAVLRILRDPNYAGEAGITIGGGVADITVTGGSSKTVTAVSTYYLTSRRVEVDLTMVGGEWEVIDWRE